MDQTLTVVVANMVDDGCSERLDNTIVDDNPFECDLNNANLTYVYNCLNRIPRIVSSKLKCTRKVEHVIMVKKLVGSAMNLLANVVQ